MTKERQKDKYDLLREKTQRIVDEAKIIYASGDRTYDICTTNGDCASCLAAKARGNVDEKDFGFGFSSDEDVCMRDARDILAEELNLTIR